MVNALQLFGSYPLCALLKLYGIFLDEKPLFIKCPIIMLRDGWAVYLFLSGLSLRDDLRLMVEMLPK